MMRTMAVLCAALAFSACAARSVPATSPEQTPQLPPPGPAEAPVGDPVALVPEAIAARLAAAEDEFVAGELAFAEARLVAARTHFDAAVDLLLGLPGGARSDFRVEAAYDALLDRISALDLMMLREGDGSTESPS